MSRRPLAGLGAAHPTTSREPRNARGVWGKGGPVRCVRFAARHSTRNRAGCFLVSLETQNKHATGGCPARAAAAWCRRGHGMTRTMTRLGTRARGGAREGPQAKPQAKPQAPRMRQNSPDRGGKVYRPPRPDLLASISWGAAMTSQHPLQCGIAVPLTPLQTLSTRVQAPDRFASPAMSHCSVLHCDKVGREQTTRPSARDPSSCQPAKGRADPLTPCPRMLFLKNRVARAERWLAAPPDFGAGARVARHAEIH